MDDVEDGGFPLLFVGDLCDVHELSIEAVSEQRLGKTPKVGLEDGGDDVHVLVLVGDWWVDLVSIDGGFHSIKLALACLKKFFILFTMEFNLFLIEFCTHHSQRASSPPRKVLFPAGSTHITQSHRKFFVQLCRDDPEAMC